MSNPDTNGAYEAQSPCLYGRDPKDCSACQEAQAMVAQGTTPLAYDRDVLVEVITYHHKVNIKGCQCGWADLGRSHSEHVATVYEESVRARSAGTRDRAAGGAS